MAFGKQREQGAGARRILQHALAGAGHVYVTDRLVFVVPSGLTDFGDQLTEIAVRLGPDVGVDAVQAVLLEQVRLAQVAQIVGDAAALAPPRHGPDIGRDDSEADEAADQFQSFHGQTRRRPSFDWWRLHRRTGDAGAFGSSALSHIPGWKDKPGAATLAQSLRRSRCSVTSGGQFSRTGSRLVPTPAEV